MTLATLQDQFTERPPIVQWLQAVLHDHKGETELRDSLLQQLKQEYRDRSSGSPAWFIAIFYAYKGEIQLTLDWLERSYEAREVEMTWLAMEPDLAFIRNHPRYVALLDSMHFPESTRKKVSVSK